MRGHFVPDRVAVALAIALCKQPSPFHLDPWPGETLYPCAASFTGALKEGLLGPKASAAGVVQQVSIVEFHSRREFRIKV